MKQRVFLRILLVPLLAVLAAGCQKSQIPAVTKLIERSKLIRIACLDTNDDGRIDAADAAGDLPDITGDSVVDDADRDVVRRVEIAIPGGRPQECAADHPSPDWQVSLPAQANCEAGVGGLILLGVGGGAVELSGANFAAGARWMLSEIGQDLYDEGVPHQLVSVAPALNGAEHRHADAEAWATAYLATLLQRQPCLRVVLLGHSHGGVLVTAVAARLEEAGLGDKILLTVPLDRVTVLYSGDTESMPQDSPVFNIYQRNDDIFKGATIDQPNVENWDASGAWGPRHSEEGGFLWRVNHTTIDNSRSVLKRIEDRVLLRACAAGLC